MNIYVKYCPNVFVAKCDEEHEKGEVIPVTTKYGKENDCIVFNKVFEKEEFFYYSIVRADGYNVQERAKLKAEKYRGYSEKAIEKENDYFKKAQKDSEFLSLGEPIKVGHHSEGRHRKAIEQANDNMRKSVESEEKAELYESKAEYWEKHTDDVNLSMPESLEYYQHKLELAKEYHDCLKSGKYERRHGMSLQYANKEVKELEKKFETAKKLWE